MVEKYVWGSGKKDFILVQAMTFGYMLDVERGIKTEDIIEAIIDATGCTEDTLRPLRRNQIAELFDVVKRVTYPELFDADGKEIETDYVDDGDKKKV